MYVVYETNCIPELSLDDDISANIESVLTLKLAAFVLRNTVKNKDESFAEINETIENNILLRDRFYKDLGSDR